MTFLLGIDTGGTFTDAAILETLNDSKSPRVVATTKALTTRHDLAIGIAEAAEGALEKCGCDASVIGLVSLSTTLATNALVEGQGGRVALIAIGFDVDDLNNAGLADALGDDPVVVLPGGHTTHGVQAKPLDLDQLESQIDHLAATVTGFAVAGYFAVRNPEHELAVRDFLLARTGKAVTCSHELSARLNGPKRALTTVLNARLVPMIARLIGATQSMLAQHKITAPLMVVRGDGALVSAGFATRRPIETILSGPAASLVGARYLTGRDSAFVNDIGGTTSDVAVLENGKPQLDPDGAMVGGYRTMVEAVAMHTFGLGGDSEVKIGGSALAPHLLLGPRRLVPVSLMAMQYPQIIHPALDAQLKRALNGRHDGRFVRRSGAGLAAGLSATEQRLFDRITDTPVALEGFLQGTSETAALDRLVARGLAQVAGLTPSDATHALGQHDIWDREAARKSLALFGRRRDGTGKALSNDSLALAKNIIACVQRRSAEVVVQTAFHIDGRDGAQLMTHELVRDAIEARAEHHGQTGMARFDLSLDRPLIGLGASAHQYHPEAARLLDVEAIVPEHADVANAIGAVVGQISVRVDVAVSQPVEGRFQISGIEKAFASEDQALSQAEIHAREKVGDLAREAGAGEIEIQVTHDVKRASIEARTVFVEASISAVATGRPPIASN